MKLKKWDNHCCVHNFKYKVRTKGGNNMGTTLMKNEIHSIDNDIPANSFVEGIKEVILMEAGNLPKKNARDLIKKLRRLEHKE